MMLYLRGDKISYFQSYKNYFIAIYLMFLGFPGADLVIMSFSDQVPLMRLATQVFVTSGASIAAIWGYVATKLYMYPEPFSFRRIISRPFRPICLLCALYFVPMFLTIALVWFDPSLISSGPAQVTYVLDEITLSSLPPGSTLLSLGGLIVVSFTSYPLAVLSRRRALVKDRDVRSALRMIASVFGVISATLITGIGVSSIGYSVTGSTNVLAVILIVVAVHAFRKPSFLKSFLGVAPSLQSSPTTARYDQMLLIYGPGDERFGPISKYIIDGVNQRERVVYFYNGDVSRVTEGLSRNEVDATKFMVKGTIRVLPLGIAYPSRVTVDDTPIQTIQQLATEARTLGNDGLRVVLDYDDFLIRPVQKFVANLTDPRWTSPHHDLHVLMAFDAAAFQGEEASLAELESKIRTLDLSEASDAFSQTMGLPHDEIVGKKLLLEFDPESNYERIFRSLLSETTSNFERTVTFTRKDSPIYSLVIQEPGAKVFVLTSRVSYPKMESENLFLLPTYDTSLLLDALNKTIDAYAGSTFTIIFDNISHFVFTLGPERTYALIRQSLELMISDKITAIFSVNSKAHDEKVMSTLENMFDMELNYERGFEKPQVRRKQLVSSWYSGQAVVWPKRQASSTAVGQ